MRTVLGAVLLVHVLLSVLTFDPRLDTGGDNAHYICLARSILSGKGYSDIFEPGNPPHTQYPFGYPLLLALVMIPFRGSFVALIVLSSLLGAGSVVVLFFLLRDKCSRPLLISVSLLFAVSPLLLLYSHRVLSDVPFTFFCLLSLLLFEKAEKDERRFPPLLWACVAALAFTYHIRTVGVALIISLLLYLGLKKQFVRAAVVLGAVAVLVAPWTLRTAAVSRGGGYLTQMTLRNPYDSDSGTIGPRDLAGRLKANGEAYFSVIVPRTIVSVHEKLWPVPGRRFDIYLLGIIVSGLVLLGFADDLRRKREFYQSYVIVYMGIVLLWPQVWASDRFLLPVAGFAFYFLLKGGILLARRLDERARRSLGFLVVGLLLLSSVFVLGRDVPQYFRTMRLYAAGDRTAGYSEDWVNYFKAASYASRSTEREAVFLTRKPALFYLFADRKCLVYPFTYNRDEVFRTLQERGVTHVVVDAFYWTQTTPRYLIPVLLEHKDLFTVVFETPPPSTYVLRYEGAAKQPEGAGN